MSTMPLSEAKAHLSEVAAEVGRTHERVHITRNGREHVVLMSEQDLASLEATLELLSDAAAVQRILDAERDIADGNFVTEEEMTVLMNQRLRRERPGA